MMGDAFPELKKNPQHIKDVLREEEESFERTLDRGIALFEESADFAIKHHHGEIRGEDAFKLHDTYGFPIDLTEIMAEEKGLKVDIGEYTRLMDEARERARSAGGTGELAGFADSPPPDPVEFCDETPKHDLTLHCEAQILTWRAVACGAPPTPTVGQAISFRTRPHVLLCGSGWAGFGYWHGAYGYGRGSRGRRDPRRRLRRSSRLCRTGTC